MKKIIITLLLIPVVTVVVALVKHNVNLNKYLSKEISSNLKDQYTSQDSITEVHIVGTFHFESNTIKREDFSRYIDSISPSIILYEGTASTVKRMVKRRDYFSQLMNAFKKGKKIEKAVVLKYIKENPNCKVLPYEWKLRDKYHWKHSLDKTSKKMFTSLFKLYSDKLLTEGQLVIVSDFLKLNNSLLKIENEATVFDINNVSTDNILKRRQDYVYKDMPEIIKDRKELSKYSDFLPYHIKYWNTRNMAMVQNILKQIKDNPNEVIVVLNGFYHRYFLIEELKKYETEYKFILNQRNN